GETASEPEPDGMRMADVNALVQEALHAAGERLVRRRVRLLKRLASGLPTLLLDTGRIGRALQNLLDESLEAVRPGGRVRVETRRAGSHLVIEIAHDGHAEGGERFEQLLAAFAGGRGAPVGLSIAERIVREHGGEVRVRGEGEWGAILSLALPVRENGDRRGTGADRRLASLLTRVPPAVDARGRAMVHVRPGVSLLRGDPLILGCDPSSVGRARD